MKIYICKYCKLTGTRQVIRKHLREEHGIRGLAKDALGKRMESQLTKSTIVALPPGSIHAVSPLPSTA